MSVAEVGNAHRFFIPFHIFSLIFFADSQQILTFAPTLEVLCLFGAVDASTMPNSQDSLRRAEDGWASDGKADGGGHWVGKGVAIYRKAFTKALVHDQLKLRNFQM